MIIITIRMLKDKKEKLSDTIFLLHKLLDFGIPKHSTSYSDTKKILDAWILDPTPSETPIHKEINFLRYGRVGHLTLPAIQGEKPVFVLKVYQAEAEEEAEQEQKQNIKDTP